MYCSREENIGRINVTLCGELSEEVNCFKYLRSYVATNGIITSDELERISEGYKVLGL